MAAHPFSLEEVYFYFLSALIFFFKRLREGDQVYSLLALVLTPAVRVTLTQSFC